jgi:hypothetical protein
MQKLSHGKSLFNAARDLQFSPSGLTVRQPTSLSAPFSQPKKLAAFKKQPASQITQVPGTLSPSSQSRLTSAATLRDG